LAAYVEKRVAEFQGAVKTTCLIGNEWRSRSAAAKPLTVSSIPATKEALAEVAEAGEGGKSPPPCRRPAPASISKEWRELPARKRGQLLYRIAELLEQRAPEIAEIETKNNGKPLFESKIDVAMAVETFRYYAGWADKLTGDTAPRERQLLHLHATASRLAWWARSCRGTSR